MLSYFIFAKIAQLTARTYYWKGFTTKRSLRSANPSFDA